MSHPLCIVGRMVAESSGDESGWRIARGRRELDQLEAQWLFMVGEYARSGEWQADGFVSAAAAIASSAG